MLQLLIKMNFDIRNDKTNVRISIQEENKINRVETQKTRSEMLSQTSVIRNDESFNSVQVMIILKNKLHTNQLPFYNINCSSLIKNISNN